MDIKTEKAVNLLFVFSLADFTERKCISQTIRSITEIMKGEF